MNIDKVANALELKKLLGSLLENSEDSEAKNWTTNHLREFWQVLEQIEVDMFYEVKNRLSYVDYGGTFHMSLDDKNQVKLWRYDKYQDEWILSDKNHSPECFFRKLKIVVHSPSEYDIISKPEEDKGFGMLLLSFQPED